MKQTDEYRKLSNIIFVIDEFNSFVSSSTRDKRKLGLLTEAISELLRRENIEKEVTLKAKQLGIPEIVKTKISTKEYKLIHEPMN